MSKVGDEERRARARTDQPRPALASDGSRLTRPRATARFSGEPRTPGAPYHTQNIIIWVEIQATDTVAVHCPFAASCSGCTVYPISLSGNGP